MAAEANPDSELDKAIAETDRDLPQAPIQHVSTANSPIQTSDMITATNPTTISTASNTLTDDRSDNHETGGDLSGNLSKTSSPTAFPEPIAGAMNKKKFGKFRILLDDQQLSETGESGPASESEGYSKTPPCRSPHTTTVDNADRSADPTDKPDQFIPPTLLASNQLSTEKQTNEGDSDEEETECEPTVRRRGRPPKRRNRATRFTRVKRSSRKDIGLNENKEEANATNETDEEQAASRRRSSRLKTIEEKKDSEPESNVALTVPVVKCEPIPSHDLQQTEPTAEQIRSEPGVEMIVPMEPKSPEALPIVLEEPKEKPKSRRGRKPKSAKIEKGKEKPKEKRRSTRRKRDDSDSEDQATNHKSFDSNATSVNGFTEPLPLNELSAAANDLGTTNCSKFGSDGDESPKPEKVKSRWRRNSELESVGYFPSSQESILSSIDNQINSNPNDQPLNSITSSSVNKFEMEICKENHPLPSFSRIEDNIYLIEKKKTKFTKEAKKMVCDCILTKEERNRGIMGCGEDCLNRMLMIECGSRCPLGDHCSNKRFYKVCIFGILLHLCNCCN
jgi:hypothetical protein